MSDDMERSGTETENEALRARNSELSEYWRRQCGEQGARAEKAEKERDEERRQRIHEQGIARDAIEKLHALLNTTEDDEYEAAHAAARAFLDGVRV